MNPRIRRVAVLLGAAVLVVAGATAAAAAQAPQSSTKFEIVRSAAVKAANCLKKAGADVTIESTGPVEVMRVKAHDLPRNTEFDLFVIQVPNAPFGFSWYQGDLESDK